MLEKFQAPFLAVTKLCPSAPCLPSDWVWKAQGRWLEPSVPLFLGTTERNIVSITCRTCSCRPSRACSEHLNEAPFTCGHGERHGLLLGCSSIFKPAFERAPGRTQINASAVKCKPAIKNDREEEKKVTIGWVASCQGEEGCFHAARGKYMCIRL